MKITDPQYFLPVIEALEANNILSSGRTRPMVIRGVCQTTGVRSEYVLKLKGSPEMFPSSNLNELLSSYIARELDFPVPEPVVINVSQAFVETMRHRHDNFSLAEKSLGFNFGSALHTHYQEIVPGQPISQELKQSLYELFALDVFLGNTDRRRDKPNFLSNGKDLLIYDHELAFSFTKLLSFARNPAPWTILEADMEWLANNFCFQHLKGTSFDFTNFAARLERINDAFWTRAEGLIPADWLTDEFGVIRTCLTGIVQHKNEFASELNRVLQ
ncbi:MAG TPA: HipA family kinase [Flavisolibacter sp.]|nr:HipA family kinase [Flavisolibacter sp.]